MRPHTIKQLEILSKICNNANNFQLGGLENLQNAGKLRQWKRFDSSILEKIENKFADIAMIGEEINNLTCILKNSKRRR
jgi:hypothetical protein